MQERSKHYRREGEARVEVLGGRSLRSLGCYKQRSQHVETKRFAENVNDIAKLN